MMNIFTIMVVIAAFVLRLWMETKSPVWLLASILLAYWIAKSIGSGSVDKLISLGIGCMLAVMLKSVSVSAWIYPLLEVLR